jgi:hypothetical protein
MEFLNENKFIDARIKNQIILNDWKFRFWNFSLYFKK